MKLMSIFIGSKNQREGIPTSNMFEGEVTVKDWNSENNSFPSLIRVNGRLYSTWRKGSHHATNPGVVQMSYSDDDGENWSIPSTIYDGSNMPSLFPNVYSQYPGVGVDVRDGILTVISSSKVMMSGFIALSEEMPGDPSYSWTVRYRTVYFKVFQYSGNIIDFSNPITESYINNYSTQSEWSNMAKFGQLDVYNGDIFASLYDIQGGVSVHKSENLGSTWIEVSDLLPSGGYTGNETALVRNGYTLTALIRNAVEDSNGGSDAIAMESNDNGLTWSSPQLVDNVIQGQYGIKLDSDIIAYSGRDNELRSSDQVKSVIRVYRWSTKEKLSEFVYWDQSGANNDQGYSSLIDADGIYMLLYYKGSNTNLTRTGIYFRQMSYFREFKSFNFYKELNEFSQAKTVSPIETDTHKAFPNITFIEDTIHVFYRKGRNHISMDGVIVSHKSYDFGLTWTSEEVIYDPAHLLVDYPDIIQDDPNNYVDCRDPDVIIHDGNLILTTAVAAGTYDGNSTRTYYRFYDTVLKIPIVNGEPDYGNKTHMVISEMDNYEFIYGVHEFNGEILTTSYTFGSSPLGNSVRVFSSLDGGETFNHKGTVFADNPDKCNETVLWTVGDKLYAYGRGASNPSISHIAESSDKGATWTTIKQAPYAIHGHRVKNTSANTSVFVGRKTYSAESSLFTLNGLNSDQAIWRVFTGFEGGGTNPGSDCGYMGIVEHRGKWFTVTFHGYSNAPPSYNSDCGVFFRQLNYNKESNSFSLGND